MKFTKLKEVSEIKFCVMSSSRTKMQEATSKWLACANFLKNNTVLLEFTETNIAPDKELLIQKDDIVIKRITPTFVNYINEDFDKVYAGNNLIIITPNKEIYPRYLAMILNERIKSLSESSSVGAVMKSIIRQDLEEMAIPNIDYQKQIVLGDLWFYGIELEKMKTRLIELEHIKQDYNLRKYIENFGGKNNG